MVLDEWTITDADPEWDFQVRVLRDPNSTRPELWADVYDEVVMRREENEESAQWAREAVTGWLADDWQWAGVEVLPVHRSGAEFSDVTASVGMCEYGMLPDAVDTAERAYVRKAWVEYLMHKARPEAEKALAALRAGA